MKVCHLLVVTALLSVSTTALAETKPEKLFTEGNCNNCHNPTLDAYVGPSLIKIADKYRGDKDAQEKLEKKVRSGGSGSWGVMPMPGTRTSISDVDIKVLVTWILGQKAKPKMEEKSDAKSDTKPK